MPHYLIQGAYEAEGAQGLIVEGGTSRLNEATGLMEALGGTVESLYFIWGGDDVVGIVEMPDDATAAAASLAISASGKVTVRITPLIPAEGIDAAAEMARDLSYRPPGN